MVPGRDPVMLQDLDVELMGSVLERAAFPVEHAELATVADEATIAALQELGVLVPCGDAAATVTPRRAKRCRNLVVGLSGSVAVVSALHHLIALADQFAETVDVIVSEGARQFVRPEAFSYHGFRVWTDPFVPAHGVAVPHAHLAAAADLVLVAPASASMLHKLATGACSDLIALVVAATSAPVVVAPSTNFAMWRHPPVRRNVAQLRADGVWVVDPWVGQKVAQRDQVGVGILGFDPVGLMRTLDVLLPPASAD